MTCIRQPRIPALATITLSLSSVVLFPRDVMAFMLALREAEVDVKSSLKDMSLYSFRRGGEVTDSKGYKSDPLFGQDIRGDVVIEQYTIKVHVRE